MRRTGPAGFCWGWLARSRIGRMRWGGAGRVVRGGPGTGLVPAPLSRAGTGGNESGGINGKKNLIIQVRLSLAHRFLHERFDPCLFGGSQVLQCEGGRPHAAFVEIRLVAEAERHVSRVELR